MEAGRFNWTCTERRKQDTSIMLSNSSSSPRPKLAFLPLEESPPAPRGLPAPPIAVAYGQMSCITSSVLPMGLPRHLSALKPVTQMDKNPGVLVGGHSPAMLWYLLRQEGWCRSSLTFSFAIQSHPVLLGR